jgi:hypothetical protein
MNEMKIRVEIAFERNPGIRIRTVYPSLVTVSQQVTDFVQEHLSVCNCLNVGGLALQDSGNAMFFLQNSCKPV